jgi:hypothetical protein
MENHGGGGKPVFRDRNPAASTLVEKKLWGWAGRADLEGVRSFFYRSPFIINGIFTY